MDDRKCKFDRSREKYYYFDTFNNTYVYKDGEVLPGPSQSQSYVENEVTQTVSNGSSNSSRGRGSSGASSVLSDFSGLSINDNNIETNNPYNHAGPYDLGVSNHHTYPSVGYTESDSDQTVTAAGHGYSYGDYAPQQSQHRSQHYTPYHSGLSHTPTSYHSPNGYVNPYPTRFQSGYPFGTVQRSDNELFRQVGLNVLLKPTPQSTPQNLSTDLTVPPHRILRAANTNGPNDTLNPSFQVRYPGHAFFKRGVVFRVLWPELAGTLNSSITAATNTSVLGEDIYCKIRWFVVLREAHNCCSCLSIQTYGGKGVQNKKKQHHAIIYTGKNEPSPLPSERAINEPPMGPSIRVIPNKAYKKMDPMSRINFDKVYNVEHNVKVEDFGCIDPEDEWNFISQFNSHWSITINNTQPQATQSRYDDGHTYGRASTINAPTYSGPDSTPVSPRPYNSSVPPINEDAMPGHQAQIQYYTPTTQMSPESTKHYPRSSNRNQYPTQEYAEHYPTPEAGDPYDTGARPLYHRRPNSSRSDKRQDSHQYDHRRWH